MAHVGEKLRLEIVGAAKVVGLFIELGVESHHAAIGIFQLAVDTREFLLPGADFLQCPEQFLVLKLELLYRILRPLIGKAAGDACEVVIAGRTRLLEVLGVA